MAYKRKPLTASEIIRRKYKGNKNFMTPNKLKVGKVNKNVAYELSSGSDTYPYSLGRGKRLYGVSVVSANPKTLKTTALYKKSKAFGSKNEAEAYINKLKNMMARRKR